MSIDLLEKARENLRSAERNFDDDKGSDDFESERMAFVCLWDSVDNILKFLTDYTKKRRRRGRPRTRPNSRVDDK